MWKLYLDNSFLNRPFDNPNIIQNRLEAEILFLILRLIRQGKIILVNSAMIEYENSLNPFPERKMFIEEFLKNSKIYQNVNEEIYLEAKRISKKFKIKYIDALHLATAMRAKVDYFITCDYNLVRGFKGKLKVITPLDFLKEYEKYKN
jgi:predicted nucleic acid-binding protein